MNQMQTISTVSKNLGISSRMLRYYEQIGLVESGRIDDYAYRVYDENAIRRLRQIIILRKLRVPVRQIREIFSNGDAASVIEVFERNIRELDEEITALSTIKSILGNLVRELHEKANVRLQLDLLGDSSVFTVVDSISLPKNILQEETNMSELNKAGETLDKFHRVQYVNLSPVRAVAFSAVGKEPENEALAPIKEWIDKNNLAGTARIYLFNVDPYPTDENPEYGMGCCATIPDGIDIPEPFYEMKLPGGTYAVISDYEGDPSHGWAKMETLMQDEEWAWELDGGRFPCLEEHIERADHDGFSFGFYMPVMLPVKKKHNKE